MTNSGATNVPAAEAAATHATANTNNSNNNNNNSQSGSTAHPPVAALNVYKKVAIIRGSNDVLTYEDGDGYVKTVTDLHLAAVASTPLHKPKPKDDIPVPKIKEVESYAKDLTPDYSKSLSYVRYHRPTVQELRDDLEYVVDAEDEAWLAKNSKFGGSIPKGDGDDVENIEEKKDSSTLGSKVVAPKTNPLPLSMLEIILDILEKATGFDVIVTLDQAEQLILNRLPQLYHMYPIKGKAGVVVTIRHVLYDIYQYWVSKRGKLRRPLLRRFWPVTSTEDTNPHLVFRPREKEKYKLRKKRQNDMDAYRKLQQLKQDFAQVRLMLSLVKQREEMNRMLVMLQKEWFEQKLYDATDTSGLCRISQLLDKQTLNNLMHVEKHYEVQETGGRKRGRRGGVTSSRTASRSTSPVQKPSMPMPFGASMDGNRGSTIDRRRPGSSIGGLGQESSRIPVLIAGQDNGEPAPNFLQPLPTRESYATTWEGSVPYVTTIVDGRPLPTFRFRHRPRVARGGRICIDRVPLETDPNVAPITYFRAEAAPSVPLQPKERLLDLLPPPIDKHAISRRIEEICLTALQEDYDEQERLATSSAAAAGLTDPEENDGDAVVVKLKDWLNTDDQAWGEERYAVGPI